MTRPIPGAELFILYVAGIITLAALAVIIGAPT